VSEGFTDRTFDSPGVCDSDLEALLTERVFDSPGVCVDGASILCLECPRFGSTTMMVGSGGGFKTVD